MDLTIIREKFLEEVILLRKKIKRKLTKKVSYKLRKNKLKKIKKFSNERIKGKILEQKTIEKMLQIYISFISTNVFFNAIYKTKGITNERLGRNYLKNRAMKMKEPVYLIALNRFCKKIQRRFRKVKMKIPVIIRLRGKPYRRQVKFLVRGIQNIKNMNLIWIENFNPMIYKSGLREKKERRV